MQVVAVHVHEAVLLKDGAGEGKPTVDLQRLRPLGRLGGNTYCRVAATFDLPRPDRAAAAPVQAGPSSAGPSSTK